MGESNYFDYSRSIRLDLLELYGSIYVIEHVVSEYNKDEKEKSFKCYVTDVLKVIAECNGASIHMRWIDVLTKPKENERSADEIALDIIKRAGLKVK